ncbi:MAG: endopeptidase La [Bacteroidota bacterium]|nr:endopeptidase La [Bacteroidota bacterium]MDX5403949.1 endopeptidase La [Bacteroidota bacterium]MDX5429023.1 endopeptidase La [Bacteroidota bacterium]MDX5447798.1 endopeptidase La [Bacteroidota bacterium]MDX5506687.1 endopeptidase La [Bacteroidota bacterium]
MEDFLNIDNVSFSQIAEDTEFIPLVTTEDGSDIRQEDLPEVLPILTLRNTVIFPGVATPITAGRDKSIKLINDVQKGNKLVGVISQRKASVENPGPDDLYEVGTLAKIIRSFKMPDGNVTVIIQGQKRFRILEVVGTEPYMQARVEVLEDVKPSEDDDEFKAIIGSVKDLAIQIINESPNIPTEAQFAIKNIESDTFLLNFISSNMNLEVKEKMELLREQSVKTRASGVLRHLTQELKMLEVKNEINTKVKSEFDQQQREYFLHQQMKTIQEELGGNSTEAEIEEMQKRAEKKKWTKEVGEHFKKELQKLQRLNPQMPEFSIQRNYLELMLDLPWNDYSKDIFDLQRAEKILNRDHFGLEKVKERIIEHLAVLKLKGDMKSPILCLYGPPGVGKTSLGKSIAEALGRKYVRMSLGGLRDEAEIRGHRKTYIGAMPGRVIQNIKKAGTGNPVFVLDEIDKLTYDGHGDPSSAMLEVLDPEQNNDFYDNYLEQGYDLSKVMFIATANNLNSIQPALRDRMEIIEVNGYTLEEKVQIAKKHLLPKQLKEHGLKTSDISVPKNVLEAIVEGYTRESGVRGLDKVLAKVVRYAAKSIAMEKEYEKKLTLKEVREILGPPRFDKEKYQDNDVAGVVTGLAWTPVGGEILFIESTLSRGTGKLSVTGNLGDVMKESASIALAYLKSHAEEYGIPESAFKNWDIHIHVPEGATPKDGPSAGITMLTALASLYTQRKVRARIAMTGEITLRGRVLPVGGIKEKILAAKRANIKDIILCENNRKDIEEIEPDYLKGLDFHYVRKMEEVLDLALLKEKVRHPKTFE